MSGYNPDTGWCHLTPSKWRRYYRKIKDSPNYIEDRLESKNIFYYFDRSGGLHVNCTDGEAWELLSGLKSEFSGTPNEKLTPEYLTVSDIAANIYILNKKKEKVNPSAIKINKTLVDLGYQYKGHDNWIATDKGEDYSYFNIGSNERGVYCHLKWDFKIIKFVKDYLED